MKPGPGPRFHEQHLITFYLPGTDKKKKKEFDGKTVAPAVVTRITAGG